MRGFRSKLKAVRRKKKNGSIIYTARGFVPVRLADGTFARRRVEHGLGGDTAAARKAEVDRLNAAYEDKALQVPLTFARAYLNYIDAGHPVPFYAELILAHLGVRQCSEIDDSIMLDLAKEIFKPNAAPAHINRHLYTPVIAVLSMALRKGAPTLTRPVGHNVAHKIEIPDADWYRLLMPHLTPVTAALVTFLTMHGRRLGDALGRRPADLNPADGTLAIGRTKNGEPMLIDLHPGVLSLMLAMPDWEKRQWLFRDGPGSASNVRKDIQAACRKAGITYFSPHEMGRHAFATRMLRAGYSLEYVRKAGGWKTIEMVSRRYGHLEHKEVTEAVHKVGDAFLVSVSPDIEIRGGKLGVTTPTKRAKLTANRD